MRIVVAVKQVPEASQIAFDPSTGRLIRDGVPLVLNTYDRRAVGAAVELRERQGGEVVALTMGPPAAERVLRECLALGVDRAILLTDPAFAGADTLATARTLARAIAREPFDLVLCGQQSVDAETGHVGPQLAALLNLPHIASARSMSVDAGHGRVVVERDTPSGVATIEAAMPALITAGEQLTKPSTPSAEAVAAAAARPLERLGLFDLGGAITEYGAAGSPTAVLTVERLPSRRGRSVRTVSAVEVAATALRDYLEHVPVRPVVGDPPRDFVPAGGPDCWALLGPDESADRRRAGELIRAAGAAAEPIGGRVVAVALGHEPPEFGPLGADATIVLAAGALPPLAPEPAAAALAQAIADRRPAVVVASSGYTGREALARAAALLGLGLTADCIGVTTVDGELRALKPAHGGRYVAPIAMRTTPALLTVRSGVFLPYQHRHSRAPVERLQLEPLPAPRTRLILERREVDATVGDLALAPCVVGVGAGIGDPANLELVRHLAQRLGAAIGGTRKVCDLGWLPRQAQIGLTGQTIAPALYIALGVRGGFHHAVGLVRAGRIVAINRDPAAPIFEHVDYGLVGDWAELTTALNAELDARPLRGFASSLRAT
ncbi:MAG: hypothetical protein KatS3mg060_3254 [Dehalococcoidia bacterium]|nr:MAG: hypothetical protein KatS3mg060_3254 [Dehalococcoidia bacterium]